MSRSWKCSQSGDSFRSVCESHSSHSIVMNLMTIRMPQPQLAFSFQPATLMRRRAQHCHSNSRVQRLLLSEDERKNLNESILMMSFPNMSIVRKEFVETTNTTDASDKLACSWRSRRSRVCNKCYARTNIRKRSFSTANDDL